MQNRQQVLESLRRDQTGGAPTDKYTGNTPVPDTGRLEFKIPFQCLDIPGLVIPSRPDLMGIEITVGTLFDTPWEMDVQGNGRILFNDRHDNQFDRDNNRA